jgi:RNA polymerase sigma factor (sigma-70 family)
MRVHQNQRHAAEAIDEPGEKTACSAELYQSYAPKLLTYLCKHILSRQDAEDVLLDIFLTVLQHEAELMELPEERRRAWLWTVTRNRQIDFHRHRMRRQQVPLELITDMVDEARTPEQAVLRCEEDEQLHHWLQRLSPQQQEVLVLRFAGELRCTEIAAILNKPEGTVRTVLSRALDKLRGMARI